jgi:very-long-chain enoyl-CoA reductase
VKPRIHNVLSYSVTLLVFWGVLLWRAGGAGVPLSGLIGGLLWTMHFGRRTWESVVVHRYSKPRIAASDYLTEYIYYWGFATWIAWSLSSPTHRVPALAFQIAGFIVFELAETGNARAHLALRRLRPAGGSEKHVPRGILFEWVSCPHYAFEILSWVGFNLVTQTLAGVCFMLVGAGILGAWAHTRHVAYHQQFDGQGGRELYPAKRRALVPGLF